MTSAITGQQQQLSINNLIQWGDHLSVAHPTIDIQHKAIFELGGRVYESWHIGGSLDVFRPAVDKLANLLQAHFSYEERMLADMGYADLKEHAAEHSSMLDELQKIRERFNAFTGEHHVRGGSVLTPGWPLMQLMLGFTVGHVATSDMAYSQALIASRDGALTAA